jgi:hypothetical protein
LFIRIFSTTCLAQHTETVRSFAFDRGLIDFSEPYSPAGNPALLIQRDNLRFNLEMHRTMNNYSNISISYPLSPFSGLGISWFSTSKQEVQTHTSGVFEVNNKKQTFILSLGHNFLFQWGQQIEVDFELNRFSTISLNNPAFIPYSNDQKITFLYRIGFYQKLMNNLSVGILSTPVIHYQYHTFAEAEKPRETRLSFWKETNNNTRFPLIALQWHPFPRFRFVLSNRSQSGEDDVQLASEVRLKRLHLTGAVCKDRNSDQFNTIFGIGSQIFGFTVFSAYDFAEKAYRIAASFSPERSRDLIELQDIENQSQVFYPYRLRHGNLSEITKLALKNISDNPVDISIRLSGRGLPSVTKNLNLKKGSDCIESIPVPHGFKDLQPGLYHYTVNIIAYYRGKQTIKRELAFEMKSDNDWSGEPADLRYFLQPEDESILVKSRRLLSIHSQGWKTDTLNAINAAECFYNYIRDSIKYVFDPVPLYSRQDRCQYPVELIHTRNGDCEDLSVLFISFLQSVGIEASFLEFIHPESEEGHIFVFFDSQKTMSSSISNDENLQNYIIRNSDSRESKLYIPLELTQAGLSFEQAWHYALEMYHNLAIKKKGLANGWFKIIDVY